MLKDRDLRRIDQDYVPLKYILGIHNELPQYPDHVDVLWVMINEAIKRPDRQKDTFGKKGFFNYHSNGNTENAELAITKLLELGWIEPAKTKPGHETYRILYNPFIKNKNND
jgi:hypothetical protein